MQPLLLIKSNDEIVRKIQVDGLKAALRLVPSLNVIEKESIVYSTVNEKTQIENTVTIKR